jgi:SAM-dependent methyltransferase
MDDATARYLNDLNRAFYAQTATEFHATRGAAWPGWSRLLLYLHPSLRVLDLGCGNGRFGVFLAEHGQTPLVYHGIDAEPRLLDFARSALHSLADVRPVLDQADLLTDPLPAQAYDLVVMFGLLHHVPGLERRRRLVTEAAARVVPGGLLTFACWRFMDFARFRERIVAWPPEIAVEQGDYLLDWRRGERALRYCHYIDDDEQAALIAAAGLEFIDSYRADGEDGRANSYAILRRQV